MGVWNRPAEANELLETNGEKVCHGLFSDLSVVCYLRGGAGDGLNRGQVEEYDGEMPGSDNRWPGSGVSTHA